MISDTLVQEAQQVDYFEQMYRRFEAAQAGSATVTVPLRIAETRIDLQFLSPALRALIMPALSHLICEEACAPEFRIGLWDSASSGIDAPPPPCSRDQFTDRGDIWGFNSDRIRLAFIYGEYSVNSFDAERGLGLYWTPGTDNYPYWSQASPLRPLLHWCMERKGHQLVHGAAFGSEGRGILLTGRGGIGKSTAALQALDRGAQFVGDDYVVVSGGEKPMAYPLYATAKLCPGRESEFPFLAPCLSYRANTTDEKSVFTLYPRFSSRIRQPLELRCVLVPEIADAAQSGISAASPDEIAHEASFTTVCQLPRAGRRSLDFFQRLVEDSPTGRLSLGRDADQTWEVLKSLWMDDAAAPRIAPRRRPEAPMPRVSAIIPVYNREDVIQEAIESIIAQAYPSIELIVVDDGSDDGTARVIRSLPHDIRLLHQHNGGPAAARNCGIRNATGEFIAFLDSDDLLPEGALRVLVRELVDDPELMVAKGYSQLSKFNPESGEYEYEGSPDECFPFSIPGAVFRAEAFENVGLLDPDLLFGEDTDWFKRAAEMGQKVKRVNITSLIVRRHQGNLTHGKAATELGALRVVKKALDRSRQGHQEPENDREQSA